MVCHPQTRFIASGAFGKGLSEVTSLDVSRHRDQEFQRGSMPTGPVSKRGFANDGLVVSWIFFMLAVASSFYWWGRVEIGFLKMPVAIFAIIPVAVFWNFHLSVSDSARRSARGSLRFFMPLGIFVLSLSTSLMVSSDFPRSVAVFAEFLTYVAIFIMLVGSITTTRALLLILASLNAGIAFLALEGLYRFFVLKSIWRLGAGDVHTATNMGAFMFQAVILILVARLLLDTRQRWYGRAVRALILMFMIIALGFTYSRGAWLTSVVGLLVIIRQRKAVVVAVVVGIIMLLFVSPQEIRNRLRSSVDVGGKNSVQLQDDVEIENTTRLRLRNLRATFEDIATHPFLGAGVGTYHGDDIGEDAPHNSYLRIWAEIGPIGLASFVWFLVIAVAVPSRGIPHAGEYRWLAVGLQAVLVTQITYMLLGDFAYQMYFWIFSGLAVAGGFTTARRAEFVEA